MNKTLTVVFDGQVFHPDSPLDLEPNTRYVVTIQDVSPPAAEGNAWDVLEALTGTLEAPQDWASEHDHYLYGTPKRQHETTAWKNDSAHSRGQSLWATLIAVDVQ